RICTLCLDSVTSPAHAGSLAFHRAPCFGPDCRAADTATPMTRSHEPSTRFCRRRNQGLATSFGIDARISTRETRLPESRIRGPDAGTSDDSSTRRAPLISDTLVRPTVWKKAEPCDLDRTSASLPFAVPFTLGLRFEAPDGGK